MDKGEKIRKDREREARREHDWTELRRLAVLLRCGDYFTAPRATTGAR